MGKNGVTMGRKTGFVCFLSVLILSLFSAGCATTGGGTEYADDAKFVPEREMVAPSQNKEAVKAYNKGTELMNAGKFNEAEPYLQKAIELDPLYVDAMDHLGIVYRRQKRYEDAKNMYLRSIGINDKNLVPYLNLAIVYRNLGQPRDALELYIKVTELDPEDPEGYYGIGELLQEIEEYEKSIVAFDKAIEKYNAKKSILVYDAYFYQGLNYYHLENYEAALEYLELAKKYHSNNKQLDALIRELKGK